MLTTLPDTPDRIWQELDLQTALGPALRNIKGWLLRKRHKSTPGAGTVSTGGRRPRSSSRCCLGCGRRLLCGQSSRPRGQRGAVAAPGPARRRPHAPPTSSLGSLGFTLFFMGAFAPARVHLDHVMALYNPQQHRSYTLFMGRTLGRRPSTMRPWPCGILAIRTRPSRGPAGGHVSPGAVAPLQPAFALEGVAEIHQFHREAQQTQERAEAPMTLSTEQRFAFWVVSATVLRGWVLVEQGQGAEGWRRYARVWPPGRPWGKRCTSRVFVPSWPRSGNEGQTEAGLTVLAEVLADVHANGHVTARPNCIDSRSACRPRGWVARRKPVFVRPLDVARRQQAKSPEPGLARARVGS